MTNWDTISLFNASWIISAMFASAYAVGNTALVPDEIAAVVVIIASSIVSCNFMFLRKEWKKEISG